MAVSATTTCAPHDATVIRPRPRPEGHRRRGRVSTGEGAWGPPTREHGDAERGPGDRDREQEGTEPQPRTREVARGSGRTEPGVRVPTVPLKPLPSLPILLTACHPPPPSPVTTPTGTRPRCSHGASACRTWPSRTRRGGSRGGAVPGARPPARWTPLDQGLPAQCPRRRDLGKREVGLSWGRGCGPTLHVHAHTRTHVQHVHACTQTRCSYHTHVCMHTCNTRTYRCAQTAVLHTYACTCAHMRNTCTHTHTTPLFISCARVHAHVCTRATRTHMHTKPLSTSHVYMHKCAHVQHARTYTHAHKPAAPCPSQLALSCFRTATAAPVWVRAVAAGRARGRALDPVLRCRANIL